MARGKLQESLNAIESISLHKAVKAKQNPGQHFYSLSNSELSP